MLGPTIKKLRLASGLSQDEVARQAGISVSFLSLVERGKREPTLTVLRRLARSLDIPFGVVLAAALTTPGDQIEEDDSQAKAIANLVDAVHLQLLARVSESKQTTLFEH
jgi:XRE family transcriptional regulator, regulator of sulfur utilization